MTAALQQPEAPPPKKRRSSSRSTPIGVVYTGRRAPTSRSTTLATMVRSDRDFVVFDAKTGDDLTHSVLTQIIVEQEAKSGGHTLLPVPFLRQLIRFYDDSIGKMVPSYLQMSMQTLVNEQERFRSQFAPFAPTLVRQDRIRSDAGTDAEKHGHVRAGHEDVDAVLRPATDRHLDCVWTSCPTPAQPAPAPQRVVSQPVQAAGSPAGDLADLKAELAAMQAKIEKLSQSRG